MTHWIWKPADSWPEICWSNPGGASLGFFLPIFSLVFFLQDFSGEDCSCWAVCTALRKSIPCSQKLLHPSMKLSFYHFTAGKAAFLGGVELPLPLQNFYLGSRRSIFYVKVSWAAEPILCWWSHLLQQQVWGSGRSPPVLSCNNFLHLTFTAAFLVQGWASSF